MNFEPPRLTKATTHMLIRKRNVAIWTFVIRDEIDRTMYMIEYDAQPLTDNPITWQRMLMDVEMQVIDKVGIGMVKPSVEPYAAKIIYYTRSVMDDLYTFHLDVYFHKNVQGEIIMKKRGWVYQLIIAHNELEPVYAIARQRQLNTNFNLIHQMDYETMLDQASAMNDRGQSDCIEALYRGRAELWSIVDADQRRELDENLLERLLRVEIDDGHHHLFVFSHTPMEDLTNMFLKVRQHMIQRHQLNIDLSGEDDSRYALIMHRYDAAFPDGSFYIFVIQQQQVQVYIQNKHGDDMNLLTQLDVSSYQRWSDRQAWPSMLDLCTLNAQKITSMAKKWHDFGNGNSLIALVINNEGRILESSIVDTVRMPNSMRRSHKLIMMLLYGAYYGEQSRFASMLQTTWKAGWYYAYVWQNTMAVTRMLDNDPPPTASNLVDLFIGGPNRSSVLSGVFDIGPKPYMIYDTAWMIRRLSAIITQNTITHVPKLRVELWKEMGLLMDELPDCPKRNHRLMENIRMMTGPEYVHLERTSRSLKNDRIIKSQMVAVPAWLGPDALSWIRYHDEMIVASKYNKAEQVVSTVEVCMGAFVNLDIDRPYDIQMQRACAPSLLRLLDLVDSPLLIKWPRSGDRFWESRIRGLTYDLKFSFTLENLMDTDMTYLINEMAVKSAMHSVEFLDLKNNVAGRPMVYAEKLGVDPSSLILELEQGWLIKRSQSLSDYALFMRLNRKYYVSAITRNGLVTWIKVNQRQLIDFYQYASGQRAAELWMERHWLNRHDVFANLFFAARHLNYPDELKRMTE